MSQTNCTTRTLKNSQLYYLAKNQLSEKMFDNFLYGERDEINQFRG